MKLKTLSIFCLFLLLFSCEGKRLPYLDTDLDFETRAADLVSRMSLEEKVGQLTHYADAVERLGIPEYNWWNECLHGVARSGKATVFPQAIGMAATFDRDMMFRMADVTSTEARAKYHDYFSRGKHGMYQGLTFWSPNINIFRDPRWGRGHETYGEDPYLTGEMGVQFIRGLQGDDPRYLKTVATSKHYIVHSGPEPLRHEFDAVVSERDFRDTYLPAFKKTVEKGQVYSVMCAYNRYQGEPCCGSAPLQEELLRGELGFRGYIVSDCGAIYDFHQGHQVVETREEAAALGVLSGTDLNCGDQYEGLVEAVKQGLITEKEIDEATGRLMLARMKLGMFDPDEMLPWSSIPVDTLAAEAHKEIAREMARKSMVLLKNDRNTLPLSKELKRVAVIGPNAHNVDVQNGNYNGTPVAPVSVLDGIRAKLGAAAEVRYAQGCPHHSALPYLTAVPPENLFTSEEMHENGMKAAFYPDLNLLGPPLLERTDEQVDFYWWDGEPPVEGLTDDNYTVKWSGYLVPEKSGTHALGVNGKFFKFVFEGDTLIRHHNIHHPNQVYQKVDLVAGRAYEIQVLGQDIHGDFTCTLHWEEPGLPLAWEALQAARWADQVVLVMGLTARLEGEEMRGLELEGFQAGDRTSLDLPAVQRQLIRQIAATGKPVSLVLMTGSAVSVTAEQKTVPAILQAWYGGEAAGEAVADVLFGDYNPAGRLPVTFYRSVNDLPPFENYDMAARTYRYFEGEVLYPFGYGLSYSTFFYDNLILERNEIGQGESLTVSVEVSNTGERDGEEVVQLYIRDVESEEARPVKDLRGFERIKVKAGQTIVATMTLGPEELSYWDPEAGDYVVEPGMYEILVGPSSASEDLLRTELMVR
ncbi:MAG: glycoside hydrolase family 3 C-terminal domain-containing protein [Bacteroidales bacterium]|nr:glycoside hydrolase family 3 C-terminal domain-containing protein [Bacteroidales bacterium]